MSCVCCCDVRGFVGDGRAVPARARAAGWRAASGWTRARPADPSAGTGAAAAAEQATSCTLPSPEPTTP